MKFKVGDRVTIEHIGSEKHGLKGEVKILLTNGAVIKIDEGRFTAVKFIHLIKYGKKESSKNGEV